jgi:hypothetical protein
MENRGVIISKPESRPMHYPKIVTINHSEPGLVIGKVDGVLPEFRGTIFEVIAGTQGPIGNFQIRVLSQGCGYVAHRDPDPRSHLAVYSDEHSYLVDCDTNQMFNVPMDGRPYVLDSTVTHSAINIGRTERYHLLWAHYVCDDPDAAGVKYSFEMKNRGESVISWQTRHLNKLLVKYGRKMKTLYVHPTDGKHGDDSRVVIAEFISREIAQDFVLALRLAVCAYGDNILFEEKQNEI